MKKSGLQYEQPRASEVRAQLGVRMASQIGTPIVQLPQTASVFNSYRVVEREESVLLPRATLVPCLHGGIQIEVLGLL